MFLFIRLVYLYKHQLSSIECVSWSDVWGRTVTFALSAQLHCERVTYYTCTMHQNSLIEHTSTLSRARPKITLYVYLTLCLVPKDIDTEGHYIPEDHIVESMSFEHIRHHHTRACYLYTFESPSHKHIIRNMLQYGHYSYVSSVHSCTITYERVTPAHC